MEVSVNSAEYKMIALTFEEWRWLIPALAAVFESDIAWFQEIHDSTPLKTLNTSQAIFPVYLEDP
ncbi:hypothetical protein C7B67_08550 [filamentous cyanobacterium Phorm 6]|nr:hypothetical protein C7B67_08550 [filamentous cyanobacterium Phorm 6]